MQFQRTTELFNSCSPGAPTVRIAEHLLQVLGDPTAQPGSLSAQEEETLQSVLEERGQDPQAWTAHWHALEEEAFC